MPADGSERLLESPHLPWREFGKLLRNLFPDIVAKRRIRHHPCGRLSEAQIFGVSPSCTNHAWRAGYLLGRELFDIRYPKHGIVWIDDGFDNFARWLEKEKADVILGPARRS